MDNHVTWRCRHCKQITAKVKWSQGKWPLCQACYDHAYHQDQEVRREAA